MAKPAVEVCPEFRPAFKRGKFCGFCKCTKLIHDLMAKELPRLPDLKIVHQEDDDAV